MSDSKWHFVEFHTREQRVYQPRSLTRYRTFTYKDNSRLPNNPHYLVIIYSNDLDNGSEFADFLRDSKDNEITIRVFFHSKHHNLINNIISSILSKTLIHLKDAPALSEKGWKQSISSNADPNLPIANLSSLVVFELEDKQQTMVKVENVMVTSPHTIVENASILAAWNRMQERKVGHLPVVESHTSYKLKGIISESDLLPWLPASTLSKRDYDAKIDDMSTKLVGSIMSRKPVAVSLDTNIKQVIKQLCSLHNEHYINLVPVLNNNQDHIVVGVISWVNVLKHWDVLATSQNTDIQTAAEIGTPFENLMAFQATDTVAMALHYLSRLRSYRHLPVLDETGKVISLIADRDILPYVPIEENNDPEQQRAFYNTLLRDVPTTHSLQDVSVPSNWSVWEPDRNDTVVGRFLQSVAGNNSWSDRIDGLLSVTVDDSGNAITLITPLDCMKILI